MKKNKHCTIFVLMSMMIFSLLTVHAESENYFVVLKSNNVPAELISMLVPVNENHNLYTVSELELVEGYEDYIEYTEKNEELVLIEGEDKISLFTLPEDELYRKQWQTQMIKSEFAWDMETYGNGVNVAVIDSGCNKHEDIVLAGGYDFVRESSDYSDNVGHGTHVAGIISAQHNGIGIAGVAPKVNIYALKCVDAYAGGTSADLVDAIYAAVDTYKCKVINMSLGIAADMTTVRNAIKYASGKGAIIISAAGNDGNKPNEKSKLWYPASYDEVVGVGSVGIDKKRSWFSQQNNSVMVVAPGESYLSTTGTKNYAVKGGTSQATPVVSGVAAVLLSADPDMTSAEFMEYIKECSEPVSDSFCGYGLINSEAMFKECMKNIPCYVSPINNGEVMVMNNTDEILEATAIFAAYDKEKYCGEKIKKFILFPDNRMKFSCAGSAGELKFFLWDSVSGMKPLSVNRSE